MARYVCVVAFKAHQCRIGFVMVESRKRGGWELPGGLIEAGEGAEEAALRELREECGLRAEVLCSVPWVEDGVLLCASVEGRVEGYKRDEIRRVGVFYTLPQDLAFQRDEYEKALELGLRLMSKRHTTTTVG